MKFYQKRQFVLASGSPRRKEYFERYQFKFRIQKADIEEVIREDESPIEATIRLSEAKAHAVLDFCDSDEIIISADTIVLLDNSILGKPGNQEDAFSMLQKLNDKTHKVISAYSILDANDQSCFTRTTETDVVFNRLPIKTLEAYSRTKDPLDKAGAYSIQGPGTFLVRAVHGSYNNVVGLPIELLIKDLMSKKLLTL